MAKKKKAVVESSSEEISSSFDYSSDASSSDASSDASSSAASSSVVSSSEASSQSSSAPAPVRMKGKKLKKGAVKSNNTSDGAKAAKRVKDSLGSSVGPIEPKVRPASERVMNVDFTPGAEDPALRQAATGTQDPITPAAVRSASRSLRRDGGTAPPPPTEKFVYTPPVDTSKEFVNDQRTQYEVAYQSLRMGLANDEIVEPPTQRFIERKELEPATPYVTGSPRFNDWPWIILMFAVFAGIVVLTIIHSGETSLDGGSVTIADDVYYIIAASVGIAVVVGTAWLVMMRMCSLQMVWTMLILPLVLLLALAGISASNNPAGAIVWVVFAIFYGIYCYLVRHRVPFAAELIRVSSGLVPRYHGTLVVSAIAVILLVGYSVFWMYNIFLLLAIRTDSDPRTGQLVFLIFAYYAISQLIKFITHTTTAGVIGSWYFLGGTASMPKNPAKGAFIRTITTSFGSVCMGSFFVATVKFIRTMVRIALYRFRGSCFAYCVMAILNLLEYLVRLFSAFALVQVALYGKTFGAAAKQTWNMFKDVGLEAIINDDLTGNVITGGMLVAALANGVVAYFWGYDLWIDGYDSTTVPTTNLISFIFAIVGAILVGLMITAAMLTPIESTIQTLFVCLAEQPAIMFLRDPSFMGVMYERIRQLPPPKQVD